MKSFRIQFCFRSFKYPLRFYSQNLESDPDFKPKSKINQKEEIEDDIEETEFEELELDIELKGDELKSEIKEIIKKSNILLFMKGNPDMPQCGYSKFVVEVLKFYKVPKYHSLNVLGGEDHRSAIKNVSDWATFPQLYVNGEFIGGADIVMELHKDGTLRESLGLE